VHKNSTQTVAGGSTRIPYSPRSPGDCLAKMPPGFCRYNGRIPYSSQTFTVLPTKHIGATIIIAPGTSLRSIANVTLKAQENRQFCKERIRRRTGRWGCRQIPCAPPRNTVPPTKFYRTLREFLLYCSRRITVRSTNFYRTARKAFCEDILQIAYKFHEFQAHPVCRSIVKCFCCLQVGVLKDA
jgi:hypothetical protein